MMFTFTPVISSLTPNTALAQSPVTITGTNFGGSQGTVSFNGTPATVTAWSNQSIATVVPPNASAGPVVVTVNGVNSNGVPFAFPAPYSFSVGYAPNGNVLTAQDSINGSWTYAYDRFNRLATAANSNPQQGFGYAYDQYGNRWQQNVTAGVGGGSTLTFSGSATATTTGNCYHAAGVTNQADGYCYDAAGNLLNDGQHSYVYDAENRIISVDGGQSSYVYDEDGQRVRKVSAAGTSDYLYDLGGHVVTEVNGLGVWTRSEIYAGARHVATYNNGTTYFIQADWLGTERARVLPSGDMYETCVSLPFGDALNCTGVTDPSPNHLTGKPRDNETGLDYFGARYYSSAMGRWMTPDWGEKPTTVPYAQFGDPQSLNLYSYVKDQPTSGIDPDGHQCNLCRIPRPPEDVYTTDFRPPRIADVGGTKFVVSVGVVFPVPGEHYTAMQLNWMGGCPLSSCHTYNGLFPPLKPVYMTNVASLTPMLIMNVVPVLGEYADLMMYERGLMGGGRSGVGLVNGRVPVNSRYAGGSYPVEKLPPELQVKYPNSVRFKSTGFPDFSPYAKAEVEVEGLNGNYGHDAKLANQAAGFAKTPKGFVWHHVEDGVTMQLVPTEIHNAVRHTGGAAIIRQGLPVDID
jgi:RHS repeat-associated protein